MGKYTHCVNWSSYVTVANMKLDGVWKLQKNVTYIYQAHYNN